jgi:hypothetical protein
MIANRSFLKAGRKNCQNFKKDHARVIIDGEPFTTVNGAYSVAVDRGLKLSKTQFRCRIDGGENTWEELLRPPPDSSGSIRSAKIKATAQRKRDEMDKLISAIDQRKIDIKANIS